MQNIFLFEKRRKLSQQSYKDLKALKKRKIKRDKERNILAENYKERINKLILKLPEEEKIKPNRIRSESSKHFKTNYFTEKERVSAAFEDNRWLDTTPIPKVSYMLRKRDRSKELSSDFRFRPTTGIERVQETRKWQNTFLDTSNNSKKDINGGRVILNYFHPVLLMQTLKDHKTK